MITVLSNSYFHLGIANVGGCRLGFKHGTQGLHSKSTQQVLRKYRYSASWNGIIRLSWKNSTMIKQNIHLSFVFKFRK